MITELNKKPRPEWAEDPLEQNNKRIGFCGERLGGRSLEHGE
jgi:hypothetical protein